MGEKIKLNPIPATRINRKTGREVTRKIREVESIVNSRIPNEGGYEPKKLHTIKTRTGKEKSLVERRIGSGWIDQWIHVWEAFRNAGIPVVKSMRQFGDDKIFMKNLKHDGSEIFGKGYFVLSEAKVEEGPLPPLTDMEKKFIQVMETDLPKIETDLKDILERAKAHNLILPWDDPFELIIHPDGRWEIIVLDLSCAKESENTYLNDEIMDQGLEHLIGLRDFLVSHYKS